MHRCSDRGKTTGTAAFSLAPVRRRGLFASCAAAIRGFRAEPFRARGSACWAILKQTVAEQREAIAGLKGLKGHPNIKPSGMDKGTAPEKPSKSEKRPGRGKVMPRVGVEEKVINAKIPPGFRFEGYQSFLVQDPAISVRAIGYQRQRWVTPDGRTILAPLPEGIEGHFGPELRRLERHDPTVPR